VVERFSILETLSVGLRVYPADLANPVDWEFRAKSSRKKNWP
jgi:hypothetical protein